jgi:hypothetical protein
MSQRTIALFCAVASASAIACAGSEPRETHSDPVLAIDAAYGALTAGETDRIDELVLSVDAESEGNPNDGRARLYSGLMRLWQLGDKLSLSASPGDVLNESMTMIDRFASARVMLPHDDRVPGFLGLARIEVGKVVGDDTLVTRGFLDLDDGIAIFPAYTHFLRALALVDSPAGSADMDAALVELQTVLDTCQTPKDSSGVFEYEPGPLPHALRVCNDEGIVPHVLEGFFMEYGDAALKAGKTADEARALYQSALRAPRFDHWPFASELQARITDADQRAALYADGDPSNDPKLWNQEGHLCTGCHQDKP